MLRKMFPLLLIWGMAIGQEVAFPPLSPPRYEAATIAGGELVAAQAGFPNLEAVAPQCVDDTVAAMAAADAADRSSGLRGTRWGTKGEVADVWEKWGDRVIASCKRASAEKLLAETREWREYPAPPWKAVWHAVLLGLGDADRREGVLAELGLGGAQSRALLDFALDVPLRSNAIHVRLVDELVCQRRGTLETSAEIGRALDRAEAIRVTQDEQLFMGIELVLSGENLERVFRYAIERQPTIRAIDHEAWFGKLQPEIVEHLVDVRCMLTFRRDPGPALMQTPDASGTETVTPSGNRRRR